MMKPQRFEIWLADLNPQVGTETGKIRPVLIVQTDQLNRSHNSTIICPITTNLKPHAILTRVSLPRGAGGMLQDSEIMIDQLRAIDNSRLIRKSGVLPQPKIAIVELTLRNILQL